MIDAPLINLGKPIPFIMLKLGYMLLATRNSSTETANIADNYPKGFEKNEEMEGCPDFI